MHFKQLCILAMAVCTMSIAQGQTTNYSAENSLTFVVEGLQFHQQGKYKSAIKEYEKVHINDTNYAFALYEKSLSQMMLEDYEGSKISCKEGLKLKSANTEHLYYTNLGTSYSYLEQYDSAIAAYDSALVRYPYNSSLKFNKATALLRAERFKEGIDLLYENLRENPQHGNSHYMLGNICRDRELHAQAVLCYITYFIVDGETAQAFQRLKEVDAYLNGDMTSKDEYPDIDFLEQGFGEIDDLISNKVAVSDRYKTSAKFSYPIIKQSDLLLKSFDLIDKKEGFWGEYYIPFYKDVMDEGEFAGLANHMLASMKNYSEEVAKILAKSQSKTNGFTNYYVEKFGELYAKHDTEDGKVEYHFSNGKLAAIGKYEDGKHLGDWKFIHHTGCVSAEGLYEDGEKDGIWHYYHPHGVISDEYNYEAGVPQGAFKKFSEKGILSKDGNFKDGRYNGIISTYFPNGGLKFTQEYVAGREEGEYVKYYQNGVPSMKLNIQDGQYIDKAEFFAPNGQKTLHRPLKNGKIHGMVKRWYTDGAIQAETEFKDGNLDGSHTTYYRNGKVALKMEYKDGIQVGNSVSYHRNGSIEQESSVDESGKLNGVSKGFYDNGDPFSEFNYKKGNLIGYTYYNHDGSVLFTAKKKGKTLEYVGYDQHGNIESKGQYVNGKASGVWKYYNAVGVLTEKRDYSDGERNGEQKSYFYNGKTYSEYTAKDGNIEGDYVRYNKDGKKVYWGVYENDVRKGEFTYRSDFGVTTTKLYFSEGESEGWQEYRSSKGILTSLEYFEDNVFFGGIYFDSSGKNGQRIWMDNGTGEFVINYPNGRPRFKTNFMNGEANGAQKWYHANGALDTEGEKINGSKYGEWKSYFESGKIKWVRTYYNDELEGESIEYFENGKINTKTTYKYGDEEGPYIRYFENGKVRMEGVYSDGNKQGEFKSYVPSGDLAIIRYYEKGVLIGYTYMKEDGTLADQIKVTGEEQNIVGYFKNGKKSVDFTIVNDYYIGSFIWYYPDGSKHRVSQYDDSGRLTDTMTGYSPEGKLLYEYQYKNGMTHGICKDYHWDGTISREYNYYLDDLEGTSKFYDAKGNLESTRYYFNDNYYSGDVK